MPREKTKGELWRELQFMYVLRDKTGTFGSTTLSANEAKGQTVISVSAVTNFATADRVRVGTGDQMEEHVLEAVGASDLTLASPLHRDHLSGEAVVEREQIDLGHLNDDGVVLTAPGDHNPVTIGTRALTWAYLIGHTELVMSFSVVNWNLENLALAFGIPETATFIVGAGTAADPYRVVLDPVDYATVQNLSFAFQGIRHDGDIIRGEAWGAETNVTALNATLARATAATPLAMEARATSALAVYHWA